MATDRVVSPATRRIRANSIDFGLPHPPFLHSSGINANWFQGLNGKWSRVGPIGSNQPLNHQCQIKDAFFPLDLTFDQIEMAEPWGQLWGHWRLIDGSWVAYKGPAPKDYFISIEESDVSQVIPFGRAPTEGITPPGKTLI
jgi:hypothetical protein